MERPRSEPRASGFRLLQCRILDDAIFVESVYIQHPLQARGVPHFAVNITPAFALRHKPHVKRTCRHASRYASSQRRVPTPTPCPLRPKLDGDTASGPSYRASGAVRAIHTVELV